ncbi:MAG: acyl-CoA dehydrogenase family protein [Acidobacteria bacterium]|nr:acyl-CoA dehydrogenase family protein [Acidobacteriota bacterium]
MSARPAAFGGSFLLDTAPSGSTFTPEQLTDDHRSIARMVDEFWERDVAPALDALLRQEPGVARTLLRRASALGLTSMQIPEAYGGLALDLPSVMIAIEHLARDASYLGWHRAHSGLGLLPLVLFGSDAQKARYLPRLASVDVIAAYALTEPHAGSDALAARTRADLSPDGRHYVLTGQKMWITNGGEADLFTVFAKVNGEAFTAFLVERGFGGVTTGAEEHKMGLSGTSTTAVYFDHVKVPIENVLGEVGRGHVIALNVLNIGRLEMGLNMLMGARQILDVSLRYASERQAFGSTLAAFGAIQHKLADCVVRMFATESATWRVVGQIEADTKRRETDGRARSAAELEAFEEFAAECSIMKVLSSEMLDAVADHGVQIHGGYGYHRDYFVERAYRDARINRIFEGTNEINRLIIPGLIAKRAARAGLDLLTQAAAALARASSLARVPPAGDDDTIVDRLRTVSRLLLGAVHRQAGDPLREPQEVIMCLADTIVETFVAESVHLRARALAGTPTAAIATAIAQVHLRDALTRVAQAATTALPALHAVVDARTALDAVRALTTAEPVDVIALRRQIATTTIDAGRSLF